MRNTATETGWSVNFCECEHLALFPAKEKATFIPSRLRVLEIQLDKKDHCYIWLNDESIHGIVFVNHVGEVLRNAVVRWCTVILKLHRYWQNVQCSHKCIGNGCTTV